MLKEVERDTMIDTVKEASLEVHIEMGHMSTIDQEITRDLETEYQGKDQGQEIGIEGQGHMRVGITKKDDRSRSGRY